MATSQILPFIYENNKRTLHYDHIKTLAVTKIAFLLNIIMYQIY